LASVFGNTYTREQAL